MYFKTWKELEALSPIKNGKWNENLADLLFDFLLNDEFDGSDSQIGAAYYIARLDKNILKKDLVLLEQLSQVGNN